MDSEEKRLERFKNITIEDVRAARDHLIAAPGDIVEIPVEYYDWLIGRLEEAREALSAVLDVVDSPESKAEASVAFAHGLECDPDISTKNGDTIKAAYKLLGKERPIWGYD